MYLIKDGPDVITNGFKFDVYSLGILVTSLLISNDWLNLKNEFKKIMADASDKIC